MMQFCWRPGDLLPFVVLLLNLVYLEVNLLPLGVLGRFVVAFGCGLLLKSGLLRVLPLCVVPLGRRLLSD